ncbi:MAG: hypothetical protein LBQ24_00825 [Candidatus Peribacteria bacterium]|jgi:hypothetical protein|nr:hypothetical protein [Candidatus Peribacteria bacterium]
MKTKEFFKISDLEEITGRRGVNITKKMFVKREQAVLDILEANLILSRLGLLD